MTNRTHADEARRWLTFVLDDTDAGLRAENLAIAQVHALLAIAEALEASTRTGRECGLPGDGGLCDAHRDDRTPYLTDPTAYIEHIDQTRGTR